MGDRHVEPTADLLGQALLQPARGAAGERRHDDLVVVLRRHRVADGVERHGVTDPSLDLDAGGAAGSRARRRGAVAPAPGRRAQSR